MPFITSIMLLLIVFGFIFKKFWGNLPACKGTPKNPMPNLDWEKRTICNILMLNLNYIFFHPDTFPILQPLSEC